MGKHKPLGNKGNKGHKWKTIRLHGRRSFEFVSTQAAHDCKQWTKRLCFYGTSALKQHSNVLAVTVNHSTIYPECLWSSDVTRTSETNSDAWLHGSAPMCEGEDFSAASLLRGSPLNGTVSGEAAQVAALRFLKTEISNMSIQRNIFDERNQDWFWNHKGFRGNLKATMIYDLTHPFPVNPGRRCCFCLKSSSRLTTATIACARGWCIDFRTRQKTFADFSLADRQLTSRCEFDIIEPYFCRYISQYQKVLNNFGELQSRFLSWRSSWSTPERNGGRLTSLSSACQVSWASARLKLMSVGL